jgi:flavin prenyltransferase
MPNRPKNICVAITGASGAVYSLRLIEVLLATGHDVHLSISPSGAQVMRRWTFASTSRTSRRLT